MGKDNDKTLLKHNSMPRLVLCMFFLCLSVLLLQSCSTGSKEKSITLIWWGDIYNRAFAQKVVDRYNSKNPAVKVKVLAIEQVSGAYKSKLLTMSAAGIPPDIMLVGLGKHLEYASKGIFLPLDKYETDPEFETFKQDMWKDILDDCRYNEKLYVVPIWTNSIGIFYNKTLFDKAGVPYPAQDWTFEEFLDKAKKLTFDFNGDGRIDQFGFGGFTLSIRGWDLYMLIEAFGGHLYSNDGKKCLINTPEAINAIQWAIDLSRKYHVCPTIREVVSTEQVAGGSLGEQYFRSGKIAMYSSGRWYLDMLRKAKGLEWGVAAFPRGKKKVMFQSFVYLGISSKTKYPDECWEFLKFMLSKEGQALITQDRSDIPVLKSMAYSEEFSNYAGRPDANKVFLDMLEYASTQEFLIGASEWYKFARDEFVLVALGKLTVKDACNEVAEMFKDMVQDAR